MPKVRVGDRVRWRVLNTSPDDPHLDHVNDGMWAHYMAEQ